MTTAAQTAAVDPRPSRRQEILDLYDKLPQRSFSELLGVTPHADAETARTAFRALVKRFHPDVLGPAEADLRDKAQTVLMQITNAYDTILADATAAEAEHPGAVSRQALPAAPAPPQDQPIPRTAPEESRTTRVVESRSRGQRVKDAIENAQAYIGRGEIDAAVDVLYEIAGVAEDGERGRIRLLLAAAYVADPKRRRNALTLLSDIVREEPSNAEALTLLATLYLRDGLLARAESTLTRALAADAGYSPAREKLREVREAVRQRSASKEQKTHGGGLFARLVAMAH